MKFLRLFFVAGFSICTVLMVNIGRIEGFTTTYDKGDKIAACNITGDRRDELLVAEDDKGAISIFSEGRLIGTVGEYDRMQFGDFSTFDEGDGLGCGDLDGDGRSEILVAEDNEGEVHVFGLVEYDTGVKKLKKLYMIYGTGYDGGNSFAVGDVDGDGRDEILVAKARGRVVNIFNKDGNLVREIKTGRYDGGDSMTAGDINGDGRDEILVVEDDGGRLDVFTADGKLYERWVSTSYRGGDSLTAGDIDGDGRVEIIINKIRGREVNLFYY